MRHFNEQWTKNSAIETKLNINRKEVAKKYLFIPINSINLLKYHLHKRVKNFFEILKIYTRRCMVETCKYFAIRFLRLSFKTIFCCRYLPLLFFISVV